MYNLVIFILSCAGLTQILCYASILNFFRPTTGLLGELFRCSMCVGFHVGYFMYFIFWFCRIVLFPNFLLGVIIFAFISSFCSYALDKSFGDEGILINFKNKE